MIVTILFNVAAILGLVWCIIYLVKQLKKQFRKRKK